MGVYVPAHLHSVTAMCGGRKLASRAALLLLITIHFTNLFFPSLDFRERNSDAMSGQQALQTLKALSPVQQRRAAAILGALLADVASEFKDNFNNLLVKIQSKFVCQRIL